MKKLMSLIGVVVLLLVVSVTGADAYEYTWHEYNGHLYALTSDYSNWATAEAEAVSQGGHLATINDEAENLWLTSTFGDAHTRVIGGSSAYYYFAWIGLYDTGDRNFEWVSGEPVTYENRYLPDLQGGTYAFLHVQTHPSAGTWNAYIPANDDPAVNPMGIIEVAVVPEPISSALFLVGGAAIGFRRFRKDV